MWEKLVEKEGFAHISAASGSFRIKIPRQDILLRAALFLYWRRESNSHLPGVNRKERERAIARFLGFGDSAPNGGIGKGKAEK